MKEAYSEEESQDLGLQIPWDDVQLKGSALIVLPWAAGTLPPPDLCLLNPHQTHFQSGDFPWCPLLCGPNLDPSVLWGCGDTQQPCSVGSSHRAQSCPGWRLQSQAGVWKESGGD